MESIYLEIHEMLLAAVWGLGAQRITRDEFVKKMSTDCKHFLDPVYMRALVE